MDTLGAFLDDWEAQHGHLTPEELARAHDEMKLLPLEAGTLPCKQASAPPPRGPLVGGGLLPSR
jgi:hypothetical protein